jgi:glutamine amidotransferase-like uncharacterized protein
MKTLKCVNYTKCKKDCIIRDGSKIFVSQGGGFFGMCHGCNLVKEYEYFMDCCEMAERVESIHQEFHKNREL